MRSVVIVNSNILKMVLYKWADKGRPLISKCVLWGLWRGNGKTRMLSHCILLSWMSAHVRGSAKPSFSHRLTMKMLFNAPVLPYLSVTAINFDQPLNNADELKRQITVRQIVIFGLSCLSLWDSLRCVNGHHYRYSSHHFYQIRCPAVIKHYLP